MMINGIIFMFLIWCSRSLGTALRCYDNRRHAVNRSCLTTEGGVCFTSITRIESGRIKHTYGCMPNRTPLKGVRTPMACLVRHQLRNIHNQQCCYNADFCNRLLSVKLNIQTTLPPKAAFEAFPADVTEQTVASGGALSTSELALVIAIPSVLLVIFICLVLVLMYKRCHGTMPPYRQPKDESNENMIPDSSRVSEIMDMTSPSSSGCGIPLLVQRTVARQIHLQTVVGKGRFGEVWRGLWRGEFVAVKIFSSREENSWFREAEIYQTVMLRHDNLLGFIAADNRDNGTWLQLWLVTEYHENGSLFDYLNRCTVSALTMLRFCQSVACGLSHLHMEIIGTQGKPAIAHRDIKSKNILVKANGTCCIADLGLAVRYDSGKDAVDIAPNTRMGTKRYMPPEVINESLDPTHFEGFRRADVYSMGLVMWEVARRCPVAGSPEEFQLPYFDLVPSDPTVDDMKRIVCVEKSRPIVPNTWLLSEPKNSLCKLMRECWYDNAAARHTALRVRKTLDSMLQHELATA